jgi:putative redox protein
MTDTNEVTAEETHDSTFSVRIQCEGHTLVGDEPHALGGLNLGPSPFAVLAAALAECTVMTVRWYAQKNKWPVEHVAARVTYGKSGAAGDSVDLWHKDVTVHGAALTQEQHAKLVAVSAKCPVQKALERGCKITSAATPK